MIIDPEVEKTLQAAYIGERRVSKLIRRKNLEKVVSLYHAVKEINKASNFEEAFITASIRITAKYGDPILVKGIQELAELLLRRIEFSFETELQVKNKSIVEFAKRDPFVGVPVLTPGLLELLTAYADCKPGEHRGAIFLTTKMTFYDIYFDYLQALKDCEEEGAGCIMENVCLSNIFFYVYGRTKAGEVYIVKARKRMALKEIQVAVSKELEKLQKYLPEERKLLKL
jgi:hypothetical protein